MFDIPLPDSVTINISGGMDPSSIFVTDLEIIPPELGSALAQSQLLRSLGQSIELLVRVKIEGYTSANRVVDSNEFVFPLELCVGCLTAFPDAALSDSAGFPSCIIPGEGDEFDPVEEVPCAPGNDRPVDCRSVCGPIELIGDPYGFCVDS